jgi:hypothetical protein
MDQLRVYGPHPRCLCPSPFCSCLLYPSGSLISALPCQPPAGTLGHLAPSILSSATSSDLQAMLTVALGDKQPAAKLEAHDVAATAADPAGEWCCWPAGHSCAVYEWGHNLAMRNRLLLLSASLNSPMWCMTGPGASAQSLLCNMFQLQCHEPCWPLCESSSGRDLSLATHVQQCKLVHNRAASVLGTLQDLYWTLLYCIVLRCIVLLVCHLQASLHCLCWCGPSLCRLLQPKQQPR